MRKYMENIKMPGGKANKEKSFIFNTFTAFHFSHKYIFKTSHIISFLYFYLIANSGV